MRGRWPLPESFSIEGSERLSDLSTRFLVPGDTCTFTYLDEALYLVSETRKLAAVLGRTVTAAYPQALIAFAEKYGWPVAPPRAPADYRLPLDLIRSDLKAFQSFDDRWREIVATAARKRRADVKASSTQGDREQLAVDVARYLGERGVGVMFEASPVHLGLTPRIRSGGPITSAVLRLAFGWSSGGSDRVAPRKCAAPDCSEWFTPTRRDAQYHSATCRKRASRARG